MQFSVMVVHSSCNNTKLCNATLICRITTTTIYYTFEFSKPRKLVIFKGVNRAMKKVCWVINSLKKINRKIGKNLYLCYNPKISDNDSLV